MGQVKNKSDFTRVALLALLTVSLTGCAGMRDRLADVGQPPRMAAVQNPLEHQGFQPVSTPQPLTVQEPRQANSLWEASRQTFFKDQRAKNTGDILTVLVNIKDRGNLKNKTDSSRVSTGDTGVPNILGLQTYLGKILPDAVDPSHLVQNNSTTDLLGDGKVERQEDIQLKLAAMITQVLPNGNLVIQGKQQVRVNYELRELTLSGIIRPEDILNNNSISYEKIAEARISYGGKGTLSDMQQHRYGQQVMDAILPF